MSAVITVKSLAKAYRYAKRRGGFFEAFSPEHVTVEAVAGVDFEVGKGERVAIIGPNGAGKSTTLKMLSGILEPSSGEATVLGLTPWKQRKALAYRIGVVFGQRSQLWGELPARESFALLRHIYDQEAAPFAKRLGELTERFALAELLDQPVHRMSLGQRMRCEITASLLHGPNLLFLDEPTIGLDVTAKAAIRDFIREHARDHGQTVLLTSHDTRDIELVCDRVIVVNQGRIVVDQPTDQLRRRFLGRKIITFQSAGQGVSLNLPGVTRRASEAHATILEVDTRLTRVEQVIAAALADGGIEDVTIEDPPMEEVIAEIYASTHAA
ncbi:MAG: ATP-binding cassette domain-containing protein [Phenylobacterium sp.]|uniref:ABC transporter ATP-binding protein n=1 Tax=Phenylobacterium sp. TaxID=1871053 RepID=UPI001B6D721F|nr:ATP-binding cassette domain-containing protein [Phenylobacterium sp.]MBP7814605.1 ATP-binding cassette domain-containing protein [Phenylobacterium sp.]